MTQPATPSLLLQQLRKEAYRRLVEESIARIRKCMQQVSEAELWRPPNENTPSMGNLILHLEGNVRQWLIAPLGRIPFSRNRNQEFAEKGPLPHAELEKRLQALSHDIEQALLQIKEENLTQTYQVQGFTETGIGIILHVVEHFSYHTGQITYAVKSLKNKDMQYYGGQQLDVE